MFNKEEADEEKLTNNYIDILLPTPETLQMEDSRKRNRRVPKFSTTGLALALALGGNTTIVSSGTSAPRSR